MLDPRTRITKARINLIMGQIFFGMLALKLKIVEDLTCKTAWTDGISIGYNPKFIQELSSAELEGVTAHELLHCVFQHQLRRNGRNHKKWNRACDYTENQILIDAGFRLPKGCLLDPKFAGMSADQIYPLLPDEPGDNQPGQGNGGSGKGKPDNNGSGCGEVRDMPNPTDKTQPMTPAQVAQASADWEIATTQAAQQAKSQGSLPGSLKTLIDKLLKPKVDWKELLRRFISRIAKNDYTWSPPNTRFIHRGLYLPSLKSEEIGDVVIAIDSSGSVSEKELQQFASEVNSILEEYDTMTTVIYCDSRIGKVEEFKQDDLPIVFDIPGRGGTAFKPPFAYTEEHDLDPACFIYLTDMECHSFPEEPDFPVLWISTQEYEEPPFGEMVVLED